MTFANKKWYKIYKIWKQNKWITDCYCILVMKLVWSIYILLVRLSIYTWKNMKKRIEKQQKSNKVYDYKPVKYLNALHHDRTQKQLQHFFLNLLQKYYQLPILGALDMSGHFLQKS